ncbi:IS4 family transposase [soil metagenome]
MTAQSQVSQTFVTHFCALFRTRHEGRIPALALLIFGLVRACSVSVPSVAKSLLLVDDEVAQQSLERRFRRWLSNHLVSVEEVWTELSPTLLADWAGRAVVLVFDVTPHRATWVILTIGIVHQDRVLPLAAIVRPQQEPWDESTVAAIRPACTRIAAAMPAGATVTLLADQGLTGPDLIDLCTKLGWHFTLRVNANETSTMRVRTQDGRTIHLIDLMPNHPARTTRRVVIEGALYASAKWRQGWITIHWVPEADHPWILFSDLRGSSARVREYTQRIRIEATFQDLKRRGWNLEASHLRDDERIERLVFALALAYWWMHLLGRRAIHHGLRHRYDRRERRDRSLVAIGRAFCADRLRSCGSVPRWFQRTASGWRYPANLPKRRSAVQCVR